MRPAIVFPFLAAAAAVLLASPLARATVTVVVNSAPIQRLNQDNSTAATHGMPTGSQGLNYADCATDVKVRFTVTMAGLPDPGSYVQAWAGPSDCAPQAARTAATAACWPVYSANVAQATASTIDINVQDIVAQAGLTSTGLNLAYARATKADCATAATRIPGEATLGVYFVVVPAAGGDGASVNQPFKVKLAGPAAPTGVSLSEGDGLLNVNWTPAADSTTQGFAVYTDPPVSGGDAGASAGDAGLCSSAVLSSGTPAADLGAYLAATASGSTSVSATLTGLKNGTTYNVAVAAKDSYDNTGPLSALSSSTCGTPAPIDDFWKKYHEAGGTAGGDCAVMAPGASVADPWVSYGAAGALVVLGAALARRRS
jgi:hypothetical protein